MIHPAFRCSRCGFIQYESIDRQKVIEPQVCPQQECKQRGTYELCHERCVFASKQHVRLQETQENVPEGQTPLAMNVLVHDDMVDSVKPGDRVEVCGIYRAQGVRQNADRRTQKSIFRTYVDVVTFVKADKTRFNEDINRENGVGEDVKDMLPKQDEQQITFTEQQIKKFKEFSKDPEYYEKLANAIAPSIWEQKDVKKGVLC
jgi:DNA replication licensing factor MCM4